MLERAGWICAGCGALNDTDALACIQCRRAADRGSDDDGRGLDPLRFDGWRLVTGVVSGMAFLVSLGEFRAAVQCRAERASGSPCPTQLSAGAYHWGAYFLAVTACFLLATFAPIGGWRRGAVTLGVLLLLPILVGEVRLWSQPEYRHVVFR